MALSVSLPKQIEDRLENVVDETGLNKSEIVRRALLNDLNKLEEKV